MLKTNLFAKADEVTRANIAKAIKYMGYNMMVEMLSDKICALAAKIANPKKGTTPEMIEGYKSELAELEKDCKKYSDKAVALEEVVAPYIDVLPESLLRIIACADNSKLEKYAISWTDEESEDLYRAMCNIHDIDIDKVNTANFKKSTDILCKIVRLNLTFPETEYSEKVAIRLNNSDLRMINESFIRGFRNKYTTDKESEITTFKEVKAQTLVTAKNKKGEVVYDWTRFNAILVKIAIAKIANM